MGEQVDWKKPKGLDQVIDDPLKELLGHLSLVSRVRLASTCRRFFHLVYGSSGPFQDKPRKKLPIKTDYPRKKLSELGYTEGRVLVCRAKKKPSNCELVGSDWLGEYCHVSDGFLMNILLILTLKTPSRGGESCYLIFYTRRKRLKNMQMHLEDAAGVDCADVFLGKIETIEELCKGTNKKRSGHMLRITFVDGRTQYLAFTSFSLNWKHSRLSSELLDDAGKLSLVQDLLKTEGTLVKVPDPRRLLALQTRDRDPKPAPGGSRRSQLRVPLIPGLDCRLTRPARALADSIYDAHHLHPTPKEMFVIPCWAIYPGKSERAGEKLRDRVERQRDKAAKKGKKFPEDVKCTVERERNGRGSSLLLDGASSQLQLVPARIFSGLHDDPLGYSRLLREVGGGWFHYPEVWWRLIKEFIESPEFVSGAVPQPLFQAQLLLITNAPSNQKAITPLHKQIRDSLTDAKVAFYRGAKQGFHMRPQREEEGSNYGVVLSCPGAMEPLRRLAEWWTEFDRLLSSMGRRLVNGDGGRPSVISASLKLVLSHRAAFKEPLPQLLSTWAQSKIGDLALELVVGRKKPSMVPVKELQKWKVDRRTARALEFDSTGRNLVGYRKAQKYRKRKYEQRLRRRKSWEGTTLHLILRATTQSAQDKLRQLLQQHSK